MKCDFRRYCLGVQESEPHWTTHSKRYCTKVMFLAVVACPRWNTKTNRQFDGKNGIWQFTIMGTAKRNSRNCTAGTPVMKSMDSGKGV